MMIHAAAMAAVFVDQVQQAPVVIQCVRAAPDPWWKWLLEFALSVVPVAGGVWIAIWSFRATGKRDHERWVLDQKKADWKELLIKVTAIEEIIPFISTGLPDYRNLEQAILAILPLLQGSIFIHQAIEFSGFIGRWRSFAQYASGEFEFAINTDNNMRKDLLPIPVGWDDLERSAQERRVAELEIRQRLHDLREELRALAQKELRI